jgi:hypothetical protein
LQHVSPLLSLNEIAVHPWIVNDPSLRRRYL